ncbi:3-oxoacyl-[acyl-carrier-protein] reductase FabG [Pseudobythopirellula maris]|uniref:3-oxoacyl-[acyl-carrier-protein] reductase FabG n=1 Tax=Pseudobythopirellula maris TaxID=2527991 RepID=A0A5C5ZMG8_9BACT|nr:SDR family oxidoreductase [Pseudobythopirellula maris]TWT88358.1 3-oxoacyl-[acyl-carrier-protein] reductase FabG [Pseudobythopirellula maris]
MGYDIEGKTVLVTGANRGIGKAIVEAVLAHGAKKVYAAVRSVESAEPLVAEHGERVTPVEIDLTKPETITAAAEAASDVQVVVNNAGVLKTSTALDADALENLAFEFEVNVYGLVRVAQAFAPVLKANGGGALVQLNSVASLMSFPPFTTYCASKAASYSVTQALRRLLEEQGTQVLSVHPGPIDTDMGDNAGFHDIAEPPSLVGEGIVAALAAGDFHLWPDSMAKQVGEAYRGFAENVVEAELAVG